MSDSTTMKLSRRTRDRLRALQTDGDSTLEDPLVRALDRYEAEQFWDDAEAWAAGLSAADAATYAAWSAGVDEDFRGLSQ